MPSLEGKTAIVTGGAASIGLAIVKALHGAGANVVIAARSADKGNAVAAELGARVVFRRTDIGKDEDLDALVAATVSTFGGIDILVNNACAYGDEGAATSRQMWLDTLNVNVVASAILGEMVRPHLRKARGSIVNIGSISGAFPHLGRWAYPVSKAAVRHLTRSQAVDYAADGIRVNQLTLGHIWSDPIGGLAAGDRAHADRVAGEFNLLGRVADGEEVGRVVVFVASSDASFITGAEIPVDGGYSALGPEQHKAVIPLFMRDG